MLISSCQSLPLTPKNEKLHVLKATRSTRTPGTSTAIYDRLYKDAESRRSSKTIRLRPYPRKLGKSISRIPSIAESLLKKHRAAVEQLIWMRNRKQEEELKELKPAPTISKRSKKLALSRLHKGNPNLGNQSLHPSPLKSFKKPKEVEIKLNVSLSSDQCIEDSAIGPMTTFIPTKPVDFSPGDAEPVDTEGDRREFEEQFQISRKSSIPLEAGNSPDATTLFLVDLMEEKVRIGTSAMRREASPTSSVIYQANELPGMDCRVRLPV